MLTLFIISGGYYKVDEQAKQGPSVTFTYPYEVAGLHIH